MSAPTHRSRHGRQAQTLPQLVSQYIRLTADDPPADWVDATDIDVYAFAAARGNLAGALLRLSQGEPRTGPSPRDAEAGRTSVSLHVASAERELTHARYSIVGRLCAPSPRPALIARASAQELIAQRIRCHLAHARYGATSPELMLATALAYTSKAMYQLACGETYPALTLTSLAYCFVESDALLRALLAAPKSGR